VIWCTDTKRVSPFSDHEAVLLQMHQLQSDIEASNSRAVEKEETARKEIDGLRLQIQECLLAREQEKNVSAVAKLICSDFSGKGAGVQESPVLSRLVIRVWSRSRCQLARDLRHQQCRPPLFVVPCLPKESWFLSDL